MNMAEVKPFRAILYNKKKFRDFSKLVCPPYDIISESQQKRYYKLSRYNMIRIILGKGYPSDTKERNRYTRSAGYLNEWLNKKILLKDNAEGIYFYEQQYVYQGRKVGRRGFIALLKLQPEIIHPHEYTHLKPKEDRFQLLKEVKANLSPIFVLFSDSGKYIAKISSICDRKKPIFSIRDNSGIKNRLWRIDDEGSLEKLSCYMQGKDIFIADGHHRFEVACAYRDMLKYNSADFREGAPYNYIMAYFTDMDSRDLTIMPTHRLIKDMDASCGVSLLEKLGGYFQVENTPGIKELLKTMARSCGSHGVFGLYFKNNFYLLRLKNPRPKDELESLDVSLFNRHILKDILGLSVEDKNIIYSADSAEAVKLVDAQRAKAAFFLNPTRISQLKAAVLKKQRMPPKSTYFYPKLLSGLLIHKFE